MTRAIQTACVATALLMLWAPMLQERLHLVPDLVLDEHRSSIPRPDDWPTLFTTGTPFARRYEAYWNDTFGFRDLLIGVKHQLDYWAFRENDQVLVGRAGWLFYKSVVDKEQYYIEKASPAAFTRMLQRLERLGAVLAARGMTLVLLPCPMNDSVYPEMLPDAATRRPHPTGFERYREALLRRPAFDVVDPTPRLLELKTHFRVFHQTDFHWTDPAAAYVARDLVNHLGAASGLGPLWDQPIEIEIRADENGGEARAMGLLWPLIEERVYLSERGIRRASGRVEQVAPNEWTFTSDLPNDAPLLPPTVLFGDSFADGFDRAGLRVYFRRLQKFYNQDFRQRFASIPPGTRFVILEHIEPFLNALLGDAIWPDELR